MRIRQCERHDLPALEEHIPSPGLNRFHDARFARQQHGLSTFLIALIDEIPVGSGEVLWRGCGASEVRRRYPGCPELSGLTVWPPERQSHGIGTALVHAAEALAVRRGHHLIGMGVDDGNPRAAALYLRLGYQDGDCRYVDRYSYFDEAGNPQEAADACRFLVKAL